MDTYRLTAEDADRFNVGKGVNPGQTREEAGFVEEGAEYPSVDLPNGKTLVFGGADNLFEVDTPDRPEPRDGDGDGFVNDGTPDERPVSDETANKVQDAETAPVVNEPGTEAAQDPATSHA